jgi:deoxyribodipyrimidine photo-lyase
MAQEICLFWHRRDLRFKDNSGLYQALNTFPAVQPIFIFDSDILSKLKDPKDPRVTFIYSQIESLKDEYQKKGSDLWVFHGKPIEIFKKLFAENSVAAVFANGDYEPQAIERDLEIENLCGKKRIQFKLFKDHVVFEKNEVLTDAKKPYTVFTPYKRKWLSSLKPEHLKAHNTEKFENKLNPIKKPQSLLSLTDLGFQENVTTEFPAKKTTVTLLKNYQAERDFPALQSTSKLGLHLRFGTVSIRDLVKTAKQYSETWLSELIWREFFMQILFHYPHVEKTSFRPEYDNIAWRKSPQDFAKWCEGKTGYPMVDAGMRELNSTGFMHNRVRMVVASFLSKHLLIHWYLGERYFAEKLLDFELSANNGNWQWAAGTGCDAAPYFRIFNPEAQQKRFDPDWVYIKKWVPEFGTKAYPEPMVEHSFARDRALSEYKKGLGK